MTYNYPLRFEYIPQNLIVEFTDLTDGTVIDGGTSSWKVGAFDSGWAAHTNKLWTPVAYSKRIQLHNKIKEFNALSKTN